MNAKDAIKFNYNLSHMVLLGSIGDLTDAELFLRVTPKANHIAWQLGHMIAASGRLLSQLGGTSPLPSGYDAQYTNETHTIDDPAHFHTKAEYVATLNQLHELTLKLIDALPDAALDKPTEGAMAGFAPKFGDLLVMMGGHGIMHMGQVSVLRRHLGKPVMF